MTKVGVHWCTIAIMHWFTNSLVDVALISTAMHHCNDALMPFGLTQWWTDALFQWCHDVAYWHADCLIAVESMSWCTAVNTLLQQCTDAMMLHWYSDATFGHTAAMIHCCSHTVAMITVAGNCIKLLIYHCQKPQIWVVTVITLLFYWFNGFTLLDHKTWKRLYRIM